MRANDKTRRKTPLGTAGLLVLTLVLASGSAHGETVSVEQAQALEAQLRVWLGAVLGPDITLGERPVRLTPDNDRFRVEIPIAGVIGDHGATLEGPPLKASMRAQEGKRWILDDIRFPSPLQVSLPGKNGTWTMTLQNQQSHAVIDPRMSGPSSWDAHIGSYTTHWIGRGGERRSEAANVNMRVAWRPAVTGRIDVTQTSSSDLLATNVRMANDGVASISVAHSETTAHIESLAPERLPGLVHAALDIATMTQASPDSAAKDEFSVPAKSASLRAALSTMLDAFDDLLSGFDETTTMQDVRLHARNVDVVMQTFILSADGAAEGGKLGLRLRLVVNGLDSRSVPAGPLRTYMPRHIALTQHLAGISTNALSAVLHRALASGGSDADLAVNAETLLDNGPLAIGIDDFSADFGPASLAASGELRVAAGGQIAGAAHIRMIGLDEMLRDAQAEPALKQTLPVLIFLKGLGQADGNATVWNIDYADGRLVVNGTDFSQIAPGLAPPLK